MTERPGMDPVPNRRARLEALARRLRNRLSGLRHIPRLLYWVLWSSVISGLWLAWVWFLGREAVAIRWLALPWLALLAVPQSGLWLLASSVRELFLLPERLLSLKSGLTEQAETLFVRRLVAHEGPKGGFLQRLRDAYELHGELAAILATRAILHRFTGTFALLVGPVSFVLNCAVIALALLQSIILLI